MGYKLKYTKQAEKDARLLERSGLDRIAKNLLSIVQNDPFQTPPEFEALKGDRKGTYSRRINRKHRFVYEALPNDDGLKDSEGNLYMGFVKIISMWTHYER